MENEKIVITGSSGLLGAALFNALESDYEIIGIDIKEPDDKSKIHFYKMDLTDSSSVGKTLSDIIENHGRKFASFIHLAAYYDFSGNENPLYRDLTVDGTKRILEELGRDECQVEQFIFASTHLVMKPVERGGIIDEESEVDPKWAYPKSKVEAENVVHEKCGDMKTVILRIAGVYDDFGHSPPICQQIKRIYENDLTSHLYPGDKDKGQAFVHLGDVVDLFKSCIEKRKSLGKEEVFLIAEPETVSYEDLQDRIAQILYHKKWWTLRVPKPLAKIGAWLRNKIEHDKEFVKPWMIDLSEDHFPLSSKKASNLLDWRPKHRLYEDIGSIVESLEKSQEDWYRENGLTG